MPVTLGAGYDKSMMEVDVSVEKLVLSRYLHWRRFLSEGEFPGHVP